MILYVDGDSYTTPNKFVNSKNSYWSLFGHAIGIDEIVNYAFPRKPVDSMVRCATRFVLEHPESEIFVLLGCSVLERYDYFNSDDYTAMTSENPNPAEYGVLSESFQYSTKKNSIVFYQREFEEAKIAAQLCTFISFLKLNATKYIIHNCADPWIMSNTPIGESFFKELSKHPEVVNLDKDTYCTLNRDLGIRPVDYQQYGFNGHHGDQGNQTYANYLIKKYQELYES